MTNDKATPRPWSVEGQFISTNEHQICQVFGIKKEYGLNGEANADLIVRAVNAWSDIEALKERIKELEIDAKKFALTYEQENSIAEGEFKNER